MYLRAGLSHRHLNCVSTDFPGLMHNTFRDRSSHVVV